MESDSEKEGGSIGEFDLLFERQSRVIEQQAKTIAKLRADRNRLLRALRIIYDAAHAKNFSRILVELGEVARELTE